MASGAWLARVPPIPTAPSRSDVRRALFIVVDGLAAATAVAICDGATAGVVLFAAAAIVADLLDGVRAHRLGLSAVDDAPAVALRGLLITAAAAVAGVPMAGPSLPGGPQGVAWLITAALFTVLALAGRAIGFAAIRRLQRTRRLTSPALIVGAGSMGRRISRRMQDHPEYGLTAIGYVDDLTDPPSVQPGMLLGDIADLPELIVRHRVRHVFVAFGRMPDTDLVKLLRACDRLDCEIFVVPRFFELGVGQSTDADHLWGVPLIRLQRAAFRAHTWPAKRFLDIAIAAPALILTGPLMLAIALLLRREVGSPVLFRQIRVGLDGRPFELLKFRTLKPPGEGEKTVFSVVNPDRVGRVGRFLRRSSLDELPQLWNVLRGQMSLVGPRPEQQHYARRFAGMYRCYDERHRVLPGVTGLAQVHDLRGATSIDDRVCFDNFYIEHWSLWQDVKILTRTVTSILRMRGR